MTAQLGQSVSAHSTIESGGMSATVAESPARSRRHPRRYFLADRLHELAVLGYLQFIVGLEIDPELHRGSEMPGQS